MADTEETLIEFVTNKYTELLSSVKTDDDKIEPVVTLIEKLFETFKNTDSKHDTIVDQLKGLQTAYASLELDASDYPRYAAAVASLYTIAALKEKGTGEEEGGEGE